MQQFDKLTEDNETIERLIELIPGWSGKSYSWEPITGGITNRNYKIVIDNKANFVSIAGNHLKTLGVDFTDKCFNNRVCANLGLSPKILHFAKSERVLVSEFLPYPAFTQRSLQKTTNLHQLLNTLKKLHSGPDFRNEFDMFKLIVRYMQVVDTKSISLPPDHPDILGLARTIGASLAPFRTHLVPCHNDLIPSNILSDGKQIFLIDFDYSGQNDPCFELGNLCVEAGYNAFQTRELLYTYFGQVSDNSLSRTCLHGMLSDIGWSLWSFIQSHISTIDFDFKSYGLHRWKNAGRKIKNGECRKWLNSL
ncbi:MAG: phosphotransferase [Desulforhopalus sp.]